MKPRFLVGRSFSPSLQILSIYVAGSIIRFMDLSQLLSFPKTSLPPLNFTTISWFSIYLNLINDYLDMRMLRPIPLIQLPSIIKLSSLYLNNPLNCSNSMRQFETEIYQGIAPFGTSLFHRATEPKQQSFLEMARYTFFPYFEAYTFSFFWLIIISIVFLFSLSYESNDNYPETYTDPEFLRINQAALFNLGENYPFYIRKELQYYRVLMSMVLFRNFYHFILTCVGILMIGSYVEKIVGFKRCFVLVFITGVTAIFANNIFFDNPTLESTTPVFGVIGYSLGYFIKKNSEEWKFYIQEKINMLIMLSTLSFFYFYLVYFYSNINALSGIVSLVVGVFNVFMDPLDIRSKFIRVLALLLVLGSLTIMIIIFFFYTDSRLLPM